MAAPSAQHVTRLLHAWSLAKAWLAREMAKVETTGNDT